MTGSPIIPFRQGEAHRTRSSRCTGLAWGLAVPALLALAACSSVTLPPGLAASHALAHHVPLETTFDMRLGRPLSAAEIEARLGEVRLLFLGEHHTDPRSHAFQQEVLTRLREAGRAPGVALEMFPPSADAVLEEWRQGTLGEVEFLERSGWYTHWGFAWSHYRELFLWFREHAIPLRGVNAEQETRTAVRKGELEQLPEAVAQELTGLDDPENRLPPHDAYLLQSLLASGHRNSLSLDSPRFARYSRVQRMWDRLMGQRTARWARSRPAGSVTVLLIGSGHLAYGLGANLRAARSGGLPHLSVWDTVAPPARLDGQGRHRVPLGMADWVRVYPRQETPLAYPRLRGLKLAAADNGVKVEGASVIAAPILRELQARDVILSLNGEPAASPAALRWAYERLRFGETATLRVLREGEEITLDATPQRKEE